MNKLPAPVATTLKCTKPGSGLRVFGSLSYALTAAVLVVSCSKTSRQERIPVITLASNEKGRPQIDYAGPGIIFFRSSFDSFSFDIRPRSGGTPWLTAQGEMKFKDTNHVAIIIQSSSDRAYDLELLGVATNRNFDIPEERARETLHISAGNQQVNIERFVMFSYDFHKR